VIKLPRCAFVYGSKTVKVFRDKGGKPYYFRRVLGAIGAKGLAGLVGPSGVVGSAYLASAHWAILSFHNPPAHIGSGWYAFVRFFQSVKLSLISRQGQVRQVGSTSPQFIDIQHWGYHLSPRAAYWAISWVVMWCS
jgi:hypothetical protein